MEKIYYAVVGTRGTYDDRGEAPLSVHHTHAAAASAAKKATARYQAALAAHGGTSGGYRVVEVSSMRPGRISGRDLDSMPDAD